MTKITLKLKKYMIYLYSSKDDKMNKENTSLISELLTDEDYTILIEDILENNEFKKLENIEHHGTSRLKHSLKVSYYSYQICRILGLDHIASARAGLLHDFFISDNERTKTERIISVFTHPKKALTNSLEHFELNEKEKNIIVSHMFPINLILPEYLESWIVSIVDKIIGTYEFLEKYSLKQLHVPNIYLLLLIKIFS